jgi:hypothetical protein
MVQMVMKTIQPPKINPILLPKLTYAELMSYGIPQIIRTSHQNHSDVTITTAVDRSFVGGSSPKRNLATRPHHAADEETKDTQRRRGIA